jgi:hypothetical protein
MAVAGDRVMAAWVSRYCTGGTAAYSLTDDDGERIYPDYFGVAGNQKSIDYSAEYPDVGEIPFGCVWTARGQLLPIEVDGVEIYEAVWTKAERLTSGRRDANRVEIAGANNAGFAIVWQEDPEGLRPGQGLGPGEGWSGAIVHAKTDVWYSYVGWDDFDQVCADPTADTCDPVALAVYAGDTQPKVATPMLIPVRVSDNGKCQDGGSGINVPPYCYMDFSQYPDVMADIPDEAPELPVPDSTFCVDTVEWLTPGGATQNICVTDDDRVLIGRVGAARPRIAMHGYDQDGDGINDSAWVILGYEETKALGEGSAEEETEVAAIDVGKNLWYLSFDMFKPDIVSHGNILNQPAIDPLTGEFFEKINTDDVGLTYEGYAFDFYETEISRRFSLISQDAVDAGATGTVAFPLVKQGIINQGGPADIFARRIVLPDDFDPTTDNPYAFTNMACELWDYADGSNPYYPDGICLDAPVNISGTEVVSCEGMECPALEDVYICDETTGECEFVLGDFTRVTEWMQTEETLTAPSWQNPYDIAKGHRGFMDGDFLMVLYAWSPNYKQNAVGHDHYNLYVRRSFDGGVSWTTTPAAEPYNGTGTETCENYGWGTDELIRDCNYYAPGEFEPARNVSQLVGSRETILDPRYSPTISIPEEAWVYPDEDERDRSKYFIVYETGDNTTVITGEATPLDLFYSRATEWGDKYDVIEYEKNGVIELGWEWLENGEDQSGEASIITNPAGNFFYAVWNQGLEIGEEEHTNMDAYFRRTMYLDDTDAAPSARILFASHTYATPDAGDLTFLGGGSDNDHVGAGIVAYEWSSDVDGILGTEQELVISADSLTEGWHTISFRVLDDEGNWSTPVSIQLSVSDLPYMNCLPLLVTK